MRAVTLGLSAGGLAIGFFRAETAAAGLALLVPLAPGLVRLLGERAGAPVLSMVALALLGSAFASALARGEESVLPPRLLRFAGAFLVLSAGSAVASIARGETLYLLLRGRIDPLPVNALGMTAAERSRGAILAFLGLLLLLLALEVFSRLCARPESRERLLSAATAGAAAAFVIAAAGRFLSSESSADPWSRLHRRTGTFTDPNALGVGIGLLVPLLFAAVLRRGATAGGLRRLAALVGLAAAPLALEASGSRTGFFLAGVAVLTGAIGLARARLVSRKMLAAALAATVLAGAALVPLLPRGGGIAVGGLFQRLGAGLSSSSFADLANYRTMFWRTALEMTWDEPLSGIGLAGFPYEFPDAFARRHDRISVTDGATNAPLETAAECGLPGLVLAVFAVVPLLARAWGAVFARTALDPVARAAGASLLGLAGACQTGSHLRFPEIGLLSSLVAGFLFTERREPQGPFPADAGGGREHVAGLLAAAGVIGAFAATVPTARPSAPFRFGGWIGLYPPGPSRAPFRWSGPRACRELGPTGAPVAFRLENARPDGLPVTIALDVDGRSASPFEIPGASTRSVTVSSARDGQVLCVTGDPTFVPHTLTGSPDFRRLSFRLAPGEPP